MVNFKKLRQMIEVKGNGNITSRELNVSTFIRLHIACRGRIELHQGDEEKVIVETDENLHEFFSAENAGRTLYVSMDIRLRRPVFTSVLVKIFVRQLDLLNIYNEHGDVFCPKEITLTKPLEVKVRTHGYTELDLAVPSIKVVSQSHGNLVLKGSCEKLDVKFQSHGDFDSSQMKAAVLSMNNAAHGNVILRAEKSISIKHYGHGYVHFYGSALVEDVKQYGNGEVKHLAGEPVLAILK